MLAFGRDECGPDRARTRTLDSTTEGALNTFVIVSNGILPVGPEWHLRVQRCEGEEFAFWSGEVRV